MEELVEHPVLWFLVCACGACSACLALILVGAARRWLSAARTYDATTRKDRGWAVHTRKRPVVSTVIYEPKDGVRVKCGRITADLAGPCNGWIEVDGRRTGCFTDCHIIAPMEEIPRVIVTFVAYNSEHSIWEDVPDPAKSADERADRAKRRPYKGNAVWWALLAASYCPRAGDPVLIDDSPGSPARPCTEREATHRVVNGIVDCGMCLVRPLMKSADEETT